MFVMKKMNFNGYSLNLGLFQFAYGYRINMESWKALTCSDFSLKRKS